ncbi:MAG: hypothetical protein J3K34DRAFT_441388 [Monoraphidium minutum]|nr:MAG: hypothetical protein J3K34DRAFT_441388 [Monoraphidium minutum]
MAVLTRLMAPAQPRMQGPVTKFGTIKCSTRHVARATQSDAEPAAAAPQGAPRAPPLQSLEIDGGDKPRPLASLLTPHTVLLINGRLAMMGVSAGLAGELLTHRPAAAQLLSAPPAVLALMGLLSVASLVPLLRGAQEGDEVFGPFTPAAEMLNGKVAIVGLLALLAIEAAKGGPLL